MDCAIATRSGTGFMLWLVIASKRSCAYSHRVAVSRRNSVVMMTAAATPRRSSAMPSRSVGAAQKASMAGAAARTRQLLQALDRMKNQLNRDMASSNSATAWPIASPCAHQRARLNWLAGPGNGPSNGPSN